MSKYKSPAFDENRRNIKEYAAWRNMIDRVNLDPAYSEVSICQNWLNYDNFYNDIKNMVGWDSVDDKGKRFCIDKDLICYDLNIGKIYSKETCVMLPNIINSILVIRKFKKTVHVDCPYGVYRTKEGHFDVAGRYKNYRKHKTMENAQCFMYEKKQKELSRIVDLFRDKIDDRAIKILDKLSLRDYHKSFGIDVRV